MIEIISIMKKANLKDKKQQKSFYLSIFNYLAGFNKDPDIFILFMIYINTNPKKQVSFLNVIKEWLKVKISKIIDDLPRMI